MCYQDNSLNFLFEVMLRFVCNNRCTDFPVLVRFLSSLYVFSARLRCCIEVVHVCDTCCLFYLYLCSAIQSSDERIAAVVDTCTRFRLQYAADAGVRALCKSLFRVVTERAEFEQFWVTRCYTPSRDSRRAVIGRLESLLNEDLLVAVVSRCIFTH